MSDQSIKSFIDQLLILTRQNQPSFSELKDLVEAADSAVLPALIEVLRHADLNTERTIARILPMFGSVAVPILIEAMYDPVNHVRKIAAETLGSLRAEVAVPSLIDMLHASEPSIRYLSIKVLAQIGMPAAIPAVRPLLKLVLGADPLYDLSGASWTLEKLGEPIIPVLSEVLDDPDKAMRRLATEMLGIVSKRTAAAVPALSKALADPESIVRLAAVQSLSNIGTLAARAVPDLIKTLSDPEPTVRSLAAHTLGWMGVSSIAVITALTAALDDPEWAVRFPAMESLSRLDVKTEEVVLSLTKILSDPFDILQSTAARGLEQIGTPEALEAVKQWRENKTK